MPKIFLDHPISHGEIVGNKNVVTTYKRGEHDLPKELADKFLGMKDATSGKPIAHVPVKQEPEKGAVEVEESKKKK